LRSLPVASVKRHPFRLRLDDRLLVEQALVHRAQLFHIQSL